MPTLLGVMSAKMRPDKTGKPPNNTGQYNLKYKPIGGLQAAILGGLDHTRGPAGTLEIWEILREKYDPKVTINLIYTVLKRMTGRGLLSRTQDEVSYAKGRPKVFYTITDLGRETLEAHKNHLSQQLSALTAS